MIDRIISFSIRARWLILLLAVLGTLWGLRCVFLAPVDAIPDLSENQVIVFTDWPGHGPQEIEDQVSFPLSLELKGLQGVRVVRSSSDVGFSSLAVIFEDDVPIERARRRVGEALAQMAANFPQGASPRLGPDSAATGQIFWYTVEGVKTDPGRLRAIQDWYLRPQLASVPGVAEVASVGGMPLEYQVELDPHRLRAHGITPGAVAEAIARANVAVGGNVVHKGNAEFVARGVGWLGMRPGESDAAFEPQRVIRDLEIVPLHAADESIVLLGEVARVVLGSQPRRGILEKDGNEATGGVVMMRQGENPLEVIKRIRAKILELQTGLPSGVRVVAVYDRTPLIRDTLATVWRTLAEAMITAAVCIVIVLRHWRTALVVAVSLPLAVLFSFAMLDLLRRLSLVDVQTNLMSMAGLAISIGVLVDAAIVTAENVMHRLKKKYQDRLVSGDTSDEVLAACLQVGRPIVFAVAIMLVSFLPVFALGGLEGKMFHPLAFTKSFAMVGVGLISITLVPALCTVLVRGRLRSEDEIGLVRGLTQVYRPILGYLLDRPFAIAWIVGATLILGAAALGHDWLFRGTLALAMLLGVGLASTSRQRFCSLVSLILVGLLAQQWVTPLGREFLTPLDEGMVMDMPITVPRMSSTQAADDLRARDMIFCRFPEVEMVVGKAGRAETAADPAPLDMIETMIGFRPREFWPRRCLAPGAAERQALTVLDLLLERKLVQLPQGLTREEAANAAAMESVPLFDAQMREAAYQRIREFERDLGPRQARFLVEQFLVQLESTGALKRSIADSGLAPMVDSLLAGHVQHMAMEPTPEAIAPIVRELSRHLSEMGALAPGADLAKKQSALSSTALAWAGGLLGIDSPNLVDFLTETVRARYRQRWREHVKELNAELLDRGAALYTRLVLESLLRVTTVSDAKVQAAREEWDRIRQTQPAPSRHHGTGQVHHHGAADALPFLEPVAALDAVQTRATESFAAGLLLWPRGRAELAGFGGELDRVMQMPGWTNVWTMPIQNRVDMLATGVNTTVGVRVLGRRLDDVVRASEEIAAILKTVSGAADVIADPVRGKGQLEVFPDRAKAANLGIDARSIADLVEIALGGRVITQTVEGRERHPVRLMYARAYREDEQTLGELPVLYRNGALVSSVSLSSVADMRVTEGPAAIKGENGLLRNYVRLNVRGMDAGEFVERAKQEIAARVKLPEGVFCEWTGQFEQQARAARTLSFAIPTVIALIFVLLWWTYRDLADAALMLLAVPGALAGGMILQWLFGYPLSVAAWVGFIACFGMATSTGIVMLVYLRQAIEDAGGLAGLNRERLRMVVLDGAAHRLRPKLLTEATTLLGLAPLLLASGPGSEILRPMVVPVLGGLLIADEVIDLFLPILFYKVRLHRLSLVQSEKKTKEKQSRESSG